MFRQLCNLCVGLVLAVLVACTSPNGEPRGIEDVYSKPGADPAKFVMPQPGGPHAVGVADFEVTDAAREERFRPGQKRRIMARVWYPAEDIAVEARLYLTEQELSYINESMSRMFPQMTQASTEARRDVPSNSLPGAAISKTNDSFPLLLFSHGGWGHVASNTILMEHLASHGYIVVSVSHPYMSSVVIYPNGDVVESDKQFLQEYLSKLAERGMEDVTAWMTEPDIGKRFAAVQREYEISTLAKMYPQWREDMISVTNAIENGTVAQPVREVFDRADTQRIGYLGMSFGAVSASAAHRDLRARAAVILDGGNWDKQLLNGNIRVPLLVFHSDRKMLNPYFQDDIQYFPTSDFAFEKLQAFGDRSDVVRIEVEGTSHLDFTDQSYMPPAARADMQEAHLSGPIKGAMMQNIMNDFVRAFFDRYVKDENQAYPGDLFERYPTVEILDRSEIREWAIQNAQN